MNIYIPVIPMLRLEERRFYCLGVLLFIVYCLTTSLDPKWQTRNSARDPISKKKSKEQQRKTPITSPLASSGMYPCPHRCIYHTDMHIQSKPVSSKLNMGPRTIMSGNVCGRSRDKGKKKITEHPEF